MRPAAQTFDAGEIDERGRPGQTVLHEPEEIGAARKGGRPVAQKTQRVAERARSRVRKGVHALASTRASASSMRARVSGACRPRMPVAFATAFATAASLGMIGASPNPFTPSFSPR